MLGLKGITLVVQDWGGPIGLSYALDNPENVERIVIMNTWAWPVNRDPYYVGFSSFMGGPVGRFLIRRYNFFARVIVPKAFGDPAKLTKHIHRHYLEPLADPRDRRSSAVFPKQILGSTDWLRTLWERKDQLRSKPKLIVWGMKDIAFREQELRRWEHAFPDARVVRLDSVGHFVQEEAPTVLGTAIEQFIAERHTAV
jgi:haloalkane dehalogenase